LSPIVRLLFWFVEADTIRAVQPAGAFVVQRTEIATARHCKNSKHFSSIGCVLTLVLLLLADSVDLCVLCGVLVMFLLILKRQTVRVSLFFLSRRNKLSSGCIFFAMFCCSCF